MLNFPKGAKINGGWIVANPNAPWASLTVHHRDFWKLWDWEGWVKPQIDAALAIGMNTIATMGDLWSVANGQISREDYKARTLQIANYLKSKGAYYLTACAKVTSYVDYGMSAQTYASYALDYLLPLEAIGNCLGIYVIDEPDFGSWTPGYAAECSRLIKAGGCNIPRTISLTEDSAPLRAFLAANVHEMDWIALHCFNFPCPMTYFDHYLTTHPDIEVVLGSTGKNMTASSATGGGDVSTVVADTRGVYNLAYSGHPRVRGVLQWAVGGFDSLAIDADPQPKEHGLYDTNTTPGVFVARQHKTQLVQRFTRGSTALSLSI